MADGEASSPDGEKPGDIARRTCHRQAVHDDKVPGREGNKRTEEDIRPSGVLGLQQQEGSEQGRDNEGGVGYGRMRRGQDDRRPREEDKGNPRPEFGDHVQGRGLRLQQGRL